MYRYRVSMYYLRMSFAELVPIYFFVLEYFIDGNHSFAIRQFCTSTLLLIILTVKLRKDFASGVVELKEESVLFHSTRIKGRYKPLEMGIYYCDITEINVRKLPLIGVWAITVMGKTLPSARVISFCYKNHKELYRQLVLRSEAANPNVYISPELDKIKDTIK